MCPSESLTVEGVTAATRADAMLLLASQFDEHKVPITGDTLDAAVAGASRRPDITVAGANRYWESVEGEDGRYGGG